MIVVDSSVWIEMLRGNEAISEAMQILIEKKQVIALQTVFAELMQGAKTTQEMNLIMNYWQYLEKVDETNIVFEAGKFSFEHKLVTQGVNLIDAAIMLAALKSKAQLWTLDKKLEKIWQKLVC